MDKKKIENNKTSKNKKINDIIIKNKNNKSKINNNLKMEQYIKDIEKTSYRSVIMKVRSKLRKKDLTKNEKNEIEKNIKMLHNWRKNNPDNKTKNTKKKNLDSVNNKIIKKNINNKSSEKLLNSTINEFKNNLINDFLPSNKNNNIKQLTTKEILNLIKNN